MPEKLEPLANTYDDNTIWNFLKTKGITKDNVVNFMSETLTTDSGCNNENCELNYNGSDQKFMEIQNVGYNEKENRFLDIESMIDKDCSIDREKLVELNEKGIEPLEYFQFYYCPSCGLLSYYIE